MQPFTKLHFFTFLKHILQTSVRHKVGHSLKEAAHCKNQVLVAYLLHMLVFSCLLPQSLYFCSHPSHSGQALTAGVLQSTRRCIFLLLLTNPNLSLTQGNKLQHILSYISLSASRAEALKLYVNQTNDFSIFYCYKKFYRTLSFKSELPFVTPPHQTLFSSPMAFFQVHWV